MNGLTKAEKKLLVEAEELKEKTLIIGKMLYAAAIFLIVLDLVILIHDRLWTGIEWEMVIKQFATQLLQSGFIGSIGVYISFRYHALTLIQKLADNQNKS